jgi:minimal PKS acyl carrier protein
MTFTFEDLDANVRAAAGHPDIAPLTGETLDADFADLGCDSLVLIELINRINRSYGIHLPDAAIEYMRTPRSTLAYLNDRFAASEAGR